LQIKVSDRLTLTLTEQGFKYSNWLHIDDDVRAVVETGLDREGLLGLNPERIDLVVNSHHHLDHIRGNGLFSNARVMIHALEADILSDEVKSYYANALDLWETLMPGEGIDEANAEINFGEEIVQPSPFATGQQLLPLEDGQLLDFGHIRAEVLHTPGHSAGHCCFWFPEEGLLYSADICLTKVGPWYGEHLADPVALMRSIDRIIALNPERLVSAHIHEVVEDPVPCLQEFKGRILKREERIYQQLREHPSNIHTLADARLIYRAHPTRFVAFWEKLMLLKHLESLQSRGLVRAEDGMYFSA
jgi:glyoxylase-like metal-dependent hydrolase (beta-lactamase superfamily II)